jgi:hypothetical protein
MKNILRLIPVLLVVVPVFVCGAENRVVSGDAIDPDMYEAVFRYLFERNACEESSTNAAAYFIGLGAHAPDDDFMKRFAGHLPPVKRRSEIKIIDECLVDTTTGKRGVVFKVDDEVLFSNDTVRVKGGWYKGGLDASEGTLFVSRKAGRWRVNKYDVEFDAEMPDTWTNTSSSINNVDIEGFKRFLPIALWMTFCIELDGREFTAYSLNEKTFDAKAMAEIKEETGLKIPADAKGLAFQYYPPIDPLTFAKIKIPDAAVALLENQIKSFADSEFSDSGFAYDSCEWWPPPKKSVFLFKRTYHDGYHMEIHLAEENGYTVLYIQYFTI